MEIGSYFISWVALVPLVVLITEALIRLFKESKKLTKQIIAGAVTVALCLFGYFVNLGMFKDLNLVVSILYAIPVALAAMGFSTIDKIKFYLEIIMNFLKLIKEPKE